MLPEVLWGVLQLGLPALLCSCCSPAGRWWMVKAHWVFSSPAESRLNWHLWEEERLVHMPTLPLHSFFLLLNSCSQDLHGKRGLTATKKRLILVLNEKFFLFNICSWKEKNPVLALMIQFCPYQLLFAHRLYIRPLALGNVTYHMHCLQYLSTTGQTKDRVSTHPLKIYVRPLNLLWKQFGDLILFMILSNSFRTSTNTM